MEEAIYLQQYFDQIQNKGHRSMPDTEGTYFILSKLVGAHFILSKFEECSLVAGHFILNQIF